jgi:HSP20 family protein
MQQVPIKVYQSVDRITIAAPMPGLEPEDITVEVTADRTVVLHGRLRGILKGSNTVLADEWNAGNYERSYALPAAVDGPAANVTYGNGVVVVVLPLSDTLQPAHLQLTTLEHDRGMRIGNAGKLDIAEGTIAATVHQLDNEDLAILEEAEQQSLP